jgi:tRNA wybutosine-synthesizing protein 2
MREHFLASRLKRCLHEDEVALLPRRWRVIGEAVIVREKKGVTSWRLVGEALLSLYPRCRYVLLDRGVHGVFREPKRELIASRGTVTSFETIHRENGCVFKLDTMRIMLSQGNLFEKQRLKDICRGEVVVDMFAGIGYFTVPIAVHSAPEKVVAIELNPLSYHYLLENLRLNRVEDRVEALLGDCEKLAPVGMADRVIMGYLSSEDWLPTGIAALKPGGVLHYHEAVPLALYPQRPVKRVKEAAFREGRGIESISWRRVKKYSPGVIHCVVDAKII